LLSFPFPEPRSFEAEAPEAADTTFSKEFSRVLKDPVFARKPVEPESSTLIRFDYGELEAPVPDILVKGMVKGLLEAPAPGLAEHLAGIVVHRAGIIL